MTEFQATAKAFALARTRASVAGSLEAQLLHTAIYDARAAGLSVRGAAAALRVPKSTVARHWREGHRCGIEPPVWGTGDEYMAAQRAVWAHAPDRAARRVPYEWSEDEGCGRRVRHVAAGGAEETALSRTAARIRAEWEADQ